MDWLSRLRSILPLRVSASGGRRLIVRLHMMDSYELEECKPKIIRRERPFWREHRLDLLHLKPDGTIDHKHL
jgi:hypothetical protein